MRRPDQNRLSQTDVWALWDRRAGRLHERTLFGGRGEVGLLPGRLRIRGVEVQVDLVLVETNGIATICPSGSSYAGTRKHGGVPADGVVMVVGQPHRLTGRAIIDDTAAYYERHTSWWWSPAWEQVPTARPLPGTWSAAATTRRGPASGRSGSTASSASRHLCGFEPDLTQVDGLQLTAEAARERRENLLLRAGRLPPAFGTFSGTLPGGPEPAAGFGVMEAHDV